MPHKFNADHRDKIPKLKQRLANCSDDNEGLLRRGDLTVCISEAALRFKSGCAQPQRCRACILQRLSFFPLSRRDKQMYRANKF